MIFYRHTSNQNPIPPCFNPRVDNTPIWYLPNTSVSEWYDAKPTIFAIKERVRYYRLLT